jgi:hypothetical protein
MATEIECSGPYEFTSFNTLEPSGYCLNLQVVLSLKNSTFCPHSVENSHRLFPYTTLSVWFLNREGVCLLRGTY